MIKLIMLILLSLMLYAKTCIIAYSAKKIPDFQKERFTTLFPNYALVEKQAHYEVLKLGPFMHIDESRRLLRSVKRYYKDAFIVNCTNPITQKQKKATKQSLSSKLTPCRVDCTNFKCKECSDNHYAWELQESRLKKSIHLHIKPLIAFPKEINTSKESNETNKTCLATLLRFYTNGGVTYALGQQPRGGERLRGDYENIKLGVQYSCFTKHWKFYTDDRVILYRKHKNHTNKTGLDIDIKELYAQSYGLFANRLNFLIGRKQLFDTRSWWIDRPMDVVGIFNLHDLFRYELTVGGRLNNRTLLSDTTSLTANLKHTRFLLAHIDYQWHYLEHIGFFALKEKTTLPLHRRDLNWIGLRAYGDRYINENSKIRYWLDVGINSGEYNYQDRSGIAYEIGALYIDNNYSLGLSYAAATKEYLQPIFADNKSKFLQRDLKFRYYGEFLDPKLSNIKILSLYSTYKPSLEKTYIVALHDYRQTASTWPLHTTGYVVATNGRNKHIGDEVDFLYQYLLSLRYNYKFILSYFKGGDAFKNVATKKDGLYAKFDFTYYW